LTNDFALAIMARPNEVELLRNPYKFNFAHAIIARARLYLLYYANTNKKGLKAICVGRAFKPNYRK